MITHTHQQRSPNRVQLLTHLIDADRDRILTFFGVPMRFWAGAEMKEFLILKSVDCVCAYVRLFDYICVTTCECVITCFHVD